MFQFRISTVDVLTEEQKKEIWDILVLGDKEFIPPLSERNSTLQRDWDTEDKEESKLPTVYFENLLQQEFLLAFDEDKVVGFMSYMPNKEIELEEGKSIVADYISTILVRPEYRSNGITYELYRYMQEKEQSGSIATRTWSTNYAHLHILEKLGFQNVYTIKNNRGEGIDTVYYLKER